MVRKHDEHLLPHDSALRTGMEDSSEGAALPPLGRGTGFRVGAKEAVRFVGCVE